MKRILSFMIIGIMAFSLTACGNSASGNTTQQEAESTLEISERENDTDLNTVPADEVASADNAQQEEADTDSDSNTEENSILVAYFSLAGEQYGVGVIEEGNTSIIAKMIAEQTGADLFEIEAVNAYPETYDGLLDVSRQEMSDNARPEIVGTVDNMEDYDIVFVGYPNWWGDMPMIIYNFLESYDFSGKTVIPFCTHGGSGLSGTESTIADITGAEMMDGFDIAGEAAQNQRDKASEAVTEWLRKGGFVE
ncbi:MAG: flavodoxin [Kineothrix sp.]|nr:flavodoxin [Kineothrix sp.]